ncbi:MAG: twin-arginine translocase TatA/TatE family subunit [Bauldia sp.]|nr:twin-arginine translocase TatA/TatE family subunit [Bauldia sp.]
MGSFSIWHWLIVLAIVLILFGRGRIAQVMGDVGQGIRAFRRNSAEDEKPETPPPAIDQNTTVPPPSSTTTTDRTTP